MLWRSILSSALAGCALSACSAGPSDADLLAHVEEVERAAPQARIEIVEYRVGDGWSDGVEGVLIYRLCDPACRTKRMDTSFQKIGNGWKPVAQGKPITPSLLTGLGVAALA
jgi:hypothetical protein